MNSTDLLERMCRGVLTSADLKAIVASRGFPKAAMNPAVLAGLFLSEQGVAEAFQSLSREEIGVLHKLKALGEPVPVSFFERIYPRSKGYCRTYTQQFQPVLVKVKERLVRSGVLLMWDTVAREGETKMELWRFSLPTAFQPFLPPLIESPRTIADSGNWRSECTHERLLADLRSGASTAGGKGSEIPRFSLVDGELRLGKTRFQTNQVSSLQFALWGEQLESRGKKATGPKVASLDAPRAVCQVLAELGDNQWVVPDQITSLVGAFSGEKVDCHAVCETGWDAGMLAKLEFDGCNWFRLAPAETETAPSAYLEVLNQDQGVAASLR